jgi:hypothetical protein
LVIHFHGGLVLEQSAEDRAEKLLPVYAAAGAYPFFVIWQSGLIETFQNNMQEILREGMFSILVEKVMQFVLGKLDQSPGERGHAVELPPSFEIRDEIAAKQAVNEIPFADRDAEASGLDEVLTPTEQAQFEGLLARDAAYLNAATDLSCPDAPELQRDLEAARASADP